LCKNLTFEDTKKKSRTFGGRSRSDKDVQTDPIDEEDEDEDIYPSILNNTLPNDNALYIALTVEVPSLKDSLAK
jgi:hypothetical protein